MDDPARLAPFRARGVEICPCPTPEGRVPPRALMDALGQREIVSLLVEAGGTFAAALLEAGVAHKVRLYLAPLLIGGREAVPLLGGQGVAHLAEALRVRDLTWRRIGDDLRLDGSLESGVAPLPKPGEAQIVCATS